MNQKTPDGFLQLIVRHGHGIARDQQRLRNYLNDIGQMTKRQRAVLLYAAQQGVAEQLVDQLSSPNLSFLISRLANQLHQQHGHESDLAGWAIRAWCDALAKARSDGSVQTLRCPNCSDQIQLSGAMIGRLIECQRCYVTLRTCNEGQSVAVEPSSAAAGAVIRIGASVECQCRDLTEAMVRCDSGSKLILMPGTHLVRTSLVIDKDLAIIGEGGPARVRLEFSEGCIEQRLGKLLLDSLSLQVITPTIGRRYPAVSCTGGDLILRGCDVSSSHKECVALTGNLAAFHGHNCRFSSPKAQAIYAAAGSSIFLHECEVQQSGSSGIFIENSKASLRRTTVTRAHLRAILARKAKLLMHETSVTSIDGHGLEVVDTELDLKDCLISECKGRSILAKGSCTGSIVGLRSMNNRSTASFDPACRVSQD